MQDSVLPADQVKGVECLLGRAVLRWQRDRGANSRSSEIVSDSLPERLESRPVSSLSVSGRNDRTMGSVETDSRHETNKPVQTCDQASILAGDSNDRAQPTLSALRLLR